MVRSFQGKPVPMRTHTTSTENLTLKVYDPAMCCSTGLCGPSVNQQLLEVTRDLRRLEADGIKVETLQSLSATRGFCREHTRCRITGRLLVRKCCQ